MMSRWVQNVCRQTEDGTIVDEISTPSALRAKIAHEKCNTHTLCAASAFG